MPMQVQQEGTMWQTPIKGDFLKRSLNQYQYPTPASHLRHINLFLLEIIRIFHRTGTPFRNDDITISKWSTASGQYSNYFWGNQGSPQASTHTLHLSRWLRLCEMHPALISMCVTNA